MELMNASLGRLHNLTEIHLFYLMIIITVLTAMTITVIIIIAAVIGQVLTTLQALFYAVYVYCFPKMAAAIYLRLHHLLHCITDILPIKWWSISPSLEAQWTLVTALTNRI